MADISRRGFITLGLGSLASLTLAGCGGSTTSTAGSSAAAGSAAAASLTVSADATELEKDATATVSVDPASDSVKYASSNEHVISIAEDGTATAIKAGEATITATDGDATGEVKMSVKPATRSGKMTANIDLTAYEKGKAVRLWVPVPQSDDNQEISDVVFDAPGATTSAINTDSLGNQMLYVEWAADADPATRTATLSWNGTRTEVGCPELVEEGEPDEEAKKELEGSKNVPSNNDQITEVAKNIVGDEETYLGKARKIYDWVVANMNRDDSVKGCGEGDVCPLLAGSMTGKCTDINSTFIGLCRAVGVPAREHFGIRMSDADSTKGQHCWAEWYLPGTGWVAVDPADVLKAVLKNEWDKSSDEAKATQEYYWGNWDEKRIQQTSGRDLTLEPAQAAEPLNDFNYPYAEVDGDPLDMYDAPNFVYTYTFEESK